MLTGDKLETATCIAKSSHLVSRTQDIHIFRPVSKTADIFLQSFLAPVVVFPRAERYVGFLKICYI